MKSRVLQSAAALFLALSGIMFMLQGIILFTTLSFPLFVISSLYILAGGACNFFAIHLAIADHTHIPQTHTTPRFIILYCIALLVISTLATLLQETFIGAMLHAGWHTGTLLIDDIARITLPIIHARWLEPLLIIIPLGFQAYWTYLILTFVITPFAILKKKSQ